MLGSVRAFLMKIDYEISQTLFRVIRAMPRVMYRVRLLFGSRHHLVDYENLFGRKITLVMKSDDLKV